jgi:hypothetical protein
LCVLLGKLFSSALGSVVVIVAAVEGLPSRVNLRTKLRKCQLQVCEFWGLRLFIAFESKIFAQNELINFCPQILDTIFCF